MDKFLKYLQYELYRSAHTVEAYRRDLTQFIEFITSRGQCIGETPDSFQATDVTAAHIREWLADLASHGCAPASLRRKTQSLRAYFRFLCRTKVLKSNPAADIILAKLPKPLPDFVKDADMERIISDSQPDSIENEDIISLRDHLILHMLYATGMRRAEILSLTDNDIACGAAQIKVTGKGGKERIIPVADGLIDEIIHWQETRDRAWPNLPAPRPLIATRFGAMSPSNLELIIKRLLKGCGTGRRSPHTLRHTFATSMLNGGADLNSVRAILGHTSLSTTQIYTHLQYADLQRAYSDAHPRAIRNKKKDNFEK